MLIAYHCHWQECHCEPSSSSLGGQVGVLALDAAPQDINVNIMDSGQTLQLTGLFSPLMLTGLLRTLEYRNGDVEPDPSPRTLALLIADGEFQTTFQTSLLVELVNDNAPELDLDVSTSGLDYSSTFLEEGEAVSIAGVAVSASDDDRNAGGIVSVRVSLTDARDNSEILVVTSVPPQFVLSYLDENHTLLLTALPPVPLSIVQSLIPTISYQNLANEPTPPLTRTIQVTLSDGQLNSFPAVTTVRIVLQDDPPILTLGPNTDVFVNFMEGGGPVHLSSQLNSG